MTRVKFLVCLNLEFLRDSTYCCNTMLKDHRFKNGFYVILIHVTI